MAPKNNKRSTQPSSGKDKTPKSNREKMAQRRSQQQIFRSLDKEDYATVVAFSKGKTFNREQRERKIKAQKAATYLEEKFPTYTKKVKEGKIKVKPDLGRTVTPKDNRSLIGKVLKNPKPATVSESTYSAYLGTKKANPYNVKKKGK